MDMPLPISQDLRGVLKTGTARAHQALDAAFTGLDLASTEGLETFLYVNGILVPALESHIGQAGIQRLLPDWHERRRSAVLGEDLADFGLFPRPHQAALAMSFDVDDAALWGITYVLEGSRLGARYILADIARRAPEMHDLPLRFLRHGEERRLWTSYTRYLNASHLNGDDVARALGAANRVFSLYQERLTASIAAKHHAETVRYGRPILPSVNAGP